MYMYMYVCYMSCKFYAAADECVGAYGTHLVVVNHAAHGAYRWRAAAGEAGSDRRGAHRGTHGACRAGRNGWSVDGDRQWPGGVARIGGQGIYSWRQQHTRLMFAFHAARCEKLRDRGHYVNNEHSALRGGSRRSRQRYVSDHGPHDIP